MDYDYEELATDLLIQSQQVPMDDLAHQEWLTMAGASPPEWRPEGFNPGQQRPGGG